MNLIELKKLTKLDFEEVIKLYPHPFKQLKLQEAELGTLPSDSYVVGKLVCFTKKKCFDDRENLMKCTYVEVLHCGTSLNFDVFFYGEFADEIEHHMKVSSESFNIWAVFHNVHIIKYLGTENPWSRFSLKVRAKERASLKVTLLYQSKRQKSLPQSPQREYAQLKDVTNGGHYDVFVVVKEVLKKQTLLANGNKHSMFAIIDPSSMQMFGEAKDFLLHIFLNDSKEGFSEPIEPEDILKIRGMLGEYYKKDDKMYGKTYHSNAITKFRSYEENDEVTPVTSNVNYILTDTDKALVRSLRQWWSTFKDEIEMNRIRNAEKDVQVETTTITRKIEEVTESGSFNLYCEVTSVRIVSMPKIVVLRVQDGTRAKIFTSTVNVNTATNEVTLEVDEAAPLNHELNIIVKFEGLFCAASHLQVGDVVYLVNVNAEKSQDKDSVATLKLEMKSDQCIITKLHSHSKRARDLKSVTSKEDSTNSSKKRMRSQPRNEKNEFEDSESSIVRSPAKQIKTSSLGRPSPTTEVNYKNVYIENDENSPPTPFVSRTQNQSPQIETTVRNLIEIKELNKLDFEEIFKEFPPPFKQLNLKEAGLGNQPKNTFVVGKLKSFTKKKCFEDRENLIKCVFDEALQSGPSFNFDVFFYGEYADEIERHMKESSESFIIWAVFHNVHIVKYPGTENSWSRFSLKVRAKEKANLKVTLLYQSKNQKSLFLSPQYKYSSLKEVTNGVYYDVFVVVKEVLKKPTILANGNKHSMLAIVDPSYMQLSGEANDLLLHIFFNDPKLAFPEPIEPEDILRIRGMLGDYYKKDDKMHGKIYHSNVVIKFSNYEENDQVTPVASDVNYVLTDTDKALVKSLREWWSSYKDELEILRIKDAEKSILGETTTIVRKIEEVTEPCAFNLYCEVISVRVVTIHEIVILRIRDGTRAKVYTSVVNLSNATSDVISQTNKVVPKSQELDIIINVQGLFGQASKLLAGDIVYLVNVNAANLHEDGSIEDSRMALELQMRSDKCTITKLHSYSKQARKIKRFIEEKQSNQNSSIEPNQICLPSVTSKEHSTNSPKIKTRSQSRNESEYIDASVVRSPAKPRKTSSLDPGNATAPISKTHDVVEDEDSAPTPSTSKSPNCSPQTRTRSQRKENRNQANDSLEVYPGLGENMDLEITSSPNGDSPSQASSAITSKYSLRSGKDRLIAFEDERRNSSKLQRHRNQFGIVHTECASHPSMLLHDFFTNAKLLEKRLVWAFVRSMNSVSCLGMRHGCNDISCQHDCVYGFCTSCRLLLCAHELRNLYSEDDLRTREWLPCTKCLSPNKVTSRKSPKTALGSGSTTNTKTSKLCSKEEIGRVRCSAISWLPERSAGKQQAESSGETTESIGKVVPFLRLEVGLEDIIETPKNEFMVSLIGHDAQEFFGLIPQFSWTVGPAPSCLNEILHGFLHPLNFGPHQFCLQKSKLSKGLCVYKICETTAKLTIVELIN